VAATGALYELPTTPLGSDAVVIESAATTVMLSALVAVCAVGVEESVALTVKLVVPVAFGVPVMAPLALRVAQAGGEPEEMLQVTGGLPPALCSCALL